jgi:prepilin-type N-terminal cleavage/methylation domain-containing protein
VNRAELRSRPRARQLGFTLVEIALAVVIIALLAGAILKASQLVDSSRVRTLASTTTGVQSAYFAFQDRYGRVPGDWNAADASDAIGVAITGGGNDSGRLDTTPADPWREANALWEQLAKGRFIHGNYAGTAGVEPTFDNGMTPLNVYNRPIIVGRTSDFEGSSGLHRQVVVGRGAPGGILRELDVKLDDGNPDQGTLRATQDDASITVFTGVHNWGGGQASCMDGTPDWNVDPEAEDCNAVLLF